MQKTIKRTDKRGFTTVELVIVIAVIAILAAVLIPTFAHLIKKANQSAALQDIRNAYKLTLTEDMAKPSEERQVHGMEVYVEHPNGTRVYITIDGEASIDETDNALTHELRGERLARLDTDTDEDGTPDIEDDDDDNDGIPDDEDDDDNNDGTPDVDDPYHPSNGGNKHQGSNPGGNQGGNQGGNEDPEPHTHNLINCESIDATWHEGVCADCGETVEEKHLFNMDANGKCTKCDAVKTYAYKCDNPFGTCGHEFALTKGDLDGLNLCKISGHNPYHYVCPDCKQGCLIAQFTTCSHNGATYQQVGTKHQVSCPDCLETFTEEHDMSHTVNGQKKGTCSKCRYHLHVQSQYEPAGAGKHTYKCGDPYCPQDYVSAPFDCNAGGYDNYDADKSGHYGTCAYCRQEFSAAHTFVNEKCVTCNYTDCSHTLGNGLEWVKTKDTHALKCTICTKNSKVQYIIREEPHVYDNDDDDVCNKCDFSRGACKHTNKDTTTGYCSDCQKYIVTTSTQFETALKKATATNSDVAIVLGADIAYRNITQHLYIASAVSIDLNGKSLEIMRTSTKSIYLGAQSLNYAGSIYITDTDPNKAGTLKGGKNFTMYANRGSKFTVDGVKVEFTSALITAAKESTIEILNSTIIVTGNHAVNGMQNSSVNLTINDSHFTVDSGKAAVFSTTSNTAASGTITITSSTVNKVAFDKNNTSCMQNIKESDTNYKIEIK